MTNAALAFTNLADVTGVAISASGSVLLAQPTQLKNPHVGKKWRDNATSTFVLVDLLTSRSIDTVMLAGLSGSIPSFRVRLSTADSTGVAGNAHDSGTITGVPYFDPTYGMFVYLLPTPASARYVRIDISESGVSYIEAGRLFLGLRNVFDRNYQTPWTRTPVRTSVDVFGVGGQTYVDLRLGYWKVHASFDFVSETDRLGFIEAIGAAIVNNGHRDMLWIMDAASSNLSRDCLWGYLDQDLEVTQNIYIIPPLYNLAVEIRQRL